MGEDEYWRAFICLFARPGLYWGFFMAVKADEKYIAISLKLAKKAIGKTSPNPMVGALVVKNNQIVGHGYHKKAGTLHAERIALNKARNLSKGSTLYVSLEPCCHYGRTDPCTRAIIDAGIKRVVYSIKDPNPKVNGKGIMELKKAGIEVVGCVLANEARRLNEVYLKYITTNRPFVILKLAQSLDGRIATANGISQWITGPEARKYAHRLRSYYDAVAVGSGTVRTDNPQLTVRLVKGNNPYRIIISRSLNFPRSINLLANNEDCKTIIATSSKSARRLKIKNLIIWEIKENKNGLSMVDLIDKAGQFGISSLLVEGGSGVATSMVKNRLVDKFHIMMAPMIIGRGIEAVNDLGVRDLEKAMRLREYKIEQMGNDFLLTGYPEVQ